MSDDAKAPETSADMDNGNVVGMDDARWKKELVRKEEKVDAIRARFANAFPEKPKPVAAYLKKKRSQKKKR